MGLCVTICDIFHLLITFLLAMYEPLLCQEQYVEFL